MKKQPLIVYRGYNPHNKLCQVFGGVTKLIRFNKLWKTMEKKGVATYWLREKAGIDSKTVRRLRANDNMETKTLDRLCQALDCSLEDIAEYVKE